MQQWNNKPDTEREIDLARLGRVLIKRAWLIVAAALLCGVFTFAYSAAFIPPTYRSYFTAYVNNRMNTDTGANTSTSDLTASMGLVYVYQDIMTSRSVLAPAAEACGVSYGQIAGSVKAGVSDTAPVVTVVVETENPKLSLQLAQKIAELAPAKVAEVVDGSSMRIIDEPIAPGGKASPNNAKNGLLGALFGLIFAALACVVVDLVYDHVQNTEDIERRYNVPVIGHIPDMLHAGKSADRYSYRKAGADRR